MSFDEKMELPNLVSFSVQFCEPMTWVMKPKGCDKETGEPNLVGSFSSQNVGKESVGDGNVVEMQEEVLRNLKIDKEETHKEKEACKKRKKVIDDDPDWSPEQGIRVDRVGGGSARKGEGDTVKRRSCRLLSAHNVGVGNVVDSEEEELRDVVDREEEELRNVRINKEEAQQNEGACSKRKSLTKQDPDWSPGQGNCVQREGVAVKRNLFGPVSDRNVVKDSVGEGIRVEEKGEFRSVQNGGFANKEAEEKKEACYKRKNFPKEDPDWSPEQGSDVIRDDGSGSKRSQYERKCLEGLDYSKPIILALPASYSIKDLLPAFGWKITTPEGRSQPIYVSPSGTQYESLSKVLEEFSHQASNLVKKDRSSSRSMDYISSKGVANASFGQKMLPIVLALPAKMASFEEHEVVVDQIQASIRGESKPSGIREMDYGSSDNREKCHAELNRSDKLLRFKSVSIDGENDPLSSTLSKENVDSKEVACKQTVILSGDMPMQVKTDQEELKDDLFIPKEMGRGQVTEVAAVNERLESRVKDECLNNGKKNSDFLNVVGAKSNKNSNNEVLKDRETQAIRRSRRINGRRVAVDSEWDLELELFDGECSFYSSISVDASKLEVISGKIEPCDKDKEENSCMSERARFREVNELLASCTTEVKEKSCNSVEKSMMDMQPLKDQPDEANGEEALSVCQEMIDREIVNKDFDIKAFPICEGLADKEIMNKENDGEASSVPEEIMDKRNCNEALPIPVQEATIDKGALEVVKSFMENKQGVSFKIDDCSSNDTKKWDRKNLLEVENDPNTDTENDGEALSVPEEIMDKRNCNEALPIPVQEATIDKGELEVVKSFMENKQGVSFKIDDCSSNDTKKWDRSNLLEVENDPNTDTDMHQPCGLFGIRRSTRINGRHVPVDDKMDIGTWAVEDYICSSNFIMNELGKEVKQTTTSVESKLERESPVILLTQSPTKILEVQKPRDKKQKQLGTENIPRKYKNTVKKCNDNKKCSPQVKKNETKSQMTEKLCPSSVSKRKSVRRGRSSNGKKKKKKNGGCGLIVRTGKSDYQVNISSSSKVNILSWLINTGTIVENEKVMYRIENGTGNILKGCVTRRGIRCNCCKKVVTLLEFEAHAGSDLHQPWSNICLLSGMSLMECQSVAWEKEKKRRKIGFQMVGDGDGDGDPGDDTCGICADGGELICCDGCPATFHQDCLMLKSLPEGNWYCSFCVCAFCMLVDRGQDKFSQIMELCSCNHCGCKYHIDCLEKYDTDNMCSDSESLSYCGEECKKVASGLSEMLGISNSIGREYSWILLRRLDKEEGVGLDQQSLIVQCKVKLSLALLVLHECFVPLVDHRTRIDMISQAVYSCGSNFNRLNYEGFYTVILEKDDEEVISVATLRLHGTHIAEMPFIGTRPRYRRQGMCRRLLNAIEEMLASLHVEMLIIPAIPEMLETWMKSFSFKHLEPSHKHEIRNLNMMIFAETTMLQKTIYNKEASNARDCRSTEYGRQQVKDGSVRLHEQIKTLDDVCDAESSPQSEVSNGTTYEVLPVQNQLLPETGMRPTPSESIDVVVDEVPMHSEIVFIPNKNVQRCPQNAGEARDVCDDSTGCTLLSIRS